MDVSKLPRLSGEKKDPAPDIQPVSDVGETAEQPPVSTGARPSPAPGIPGKAWISLIVGAFLWYWQPRMLQWLASRIFHTSFNEFTMSDGMIVPYPQVPEFWMDLGPALFGLVFILDGLVLAFGRTRSLIMAAFLLTVLATGYNLFYVFASYSKYGAAPISFLAAGFGAYIAYTQWQMLRDLRTGNR